MLGFHNVAVGRIKAGTKGSGRSDDVAVLMMWPYGGVPLYSILFFPVDSPVYVDVPPIHCLHHIVF